MTQRVKKSRQNDYQIFNPILEESIGYDCRVSPPNPEQPTYSNSKNRTPAHSQRSSLQSSYEMVKGEGQREKLLSIIRQETNSNSEDDCSHAEIILLRQNAHLKEHNQYLRDQVTKMFEREKMYKKTLQSKTQTIMKLQSLNQELITQIQYLSHTLYEEIEQLQGRISLEGSRLEEGEVGDLISYSSSESLNSKISVCFDQTLAHLKENIGKIINKKTGSKTEHKRGNSDLIKESVFKKNKNRADEYNSNNETSTPSVSAEMYLKSLSNSIRKMKTQQNGESAYDPKNVYNSSRLRDERQRVERLKSLDKYVNHHE